MQFPFERWQPLFAGRKQFRYKLAFGLFNAVLADRLAV
jgi:hypothetical protein